MVKISSLIIKGYRKLSLKLLRPIWTLFTVFVFKAMNVAYQSFSTQGVPYVSVNRGRFTIGKGFRMNNAWAGNIIGRQQRCIFSVNRGELTIGNNVGISSTAIVCHNSIRIGDNVRIGGNTVIYDTDFHSLNHEERTQFPEIKDNIKTAPVVIGNNVFIGGHCTVLKGVRIGDNSIVGAGSVVAKDIPVNEIWGGNPAKFIRSING